MSLLKSAFNLIKKPLAGAIKELPIMMTGTLPNIISLVTTAVPIISDMVGSASREKVANDLRNVHNDTRAIAVKSNMNGNDTDILSLEAASYLSGLMKSFHSIADELGIPRADLDEYTAIYILERLKCPPKYIEGILRTLRFNRKFKDSGLLNDAKETSMIHVDNIKDIFNIGRGMCSVEYIIDELKNDMKPKKIVTSEGIELYEKRQEQVGRILNLVQDTSSMKSVKKVENKIYDIMDNKHQKFADEYMVEHFKTIKENAARNSEEYIFLFGRE